MKFIPAILILALFAFSCSEFKAHIRKKKNMPPIENDEPIYVFFDKYDEIPPDSAIYIGDLVVEYNMRIANAGRGIPYFYELYLLLQEEIKESGGNFLMVEQFGKSNRNMLNGKFYLIPEIGKSNYDEESIMKELENKKTKPLEGIYTYKYLNPYNRNLIPLRFGVIEVSESKYQIIYLSGYQEVYYLVALTQPSRTWKEGDIFGYLNTTKKENLYEAEIYNTNKSLNKNGTAKIDNSNLRIYFNDVLMTLVKEYPERGAYEIPRSLLTGIAIDEKHILTSYERIFETDFEVYVKGINGDFSNKYKAKVEAKDKKLDMCLLQLIGTDIKFNSIKLPLAKEEKPMSEKVFIFGYTIPTMMSDDIKLIDGLISSATGEGGSLREYQITAPLKAGNSGSPCFDDNGNLIGIMNSGVVEEDNLGYSLKVEHLIEFLNEYNIKLNTLKENELKDLPLLSRIEKLKESIFLIELTDIEPPTPPEKRRYHR